MFPPEPTTDPQTLLNNVWASLSRAGDGHWGNQATVELVDANKYVATLRTESHIPNDVWNEASKYIKKYARAAHWTVSHVTRQKGFVEMHLEYSPPKPKKERDPKPSPSPQKTEE